MRFVPTRIHGIVDWLLGALLIALPWLLGFAGGGPETYVPVALGSIGLLVTFFTDHEYGIVRRIPMSGHLAVDALARFSVGSRFCRNGLAAASRSRGDGTGRCLCHQDGPGGSPICALTHWRGDNGGKAISVRAWPSSSAHLIVASSSQPPAARSRPAHISENERHQHAAVHT